MTVQYVIWEIHDGVTTIKSGTASSRCDLQAVYDHYNQLGYFNTFSWREFVI